MSDVYADRVKCRICGLDWGMHYGEYCNWSGSGDMFHPEGINLTDICENCNYTFEEHIKRNRCPDRKTSFVKKEYKVELPDELFEV